MKIAEDLSKSLIELGREGTLLKMRLKEITLGVERETELVIKDYTQIEMKRSTMLLEEMSYDSVLDEENVSKILGYESSSGSNPLKGWRLLSRTSLSDAEIATVLRECLTFEEVLLSDVNQLQPLLEGDKAIKLKEELGKIRVGM